MTPVENSSESGNTKQSASTFTDGPVEGALLPLVRIKGELFVMDNCLHFFPAVGERSVKPEARLR
ncbi:MAG TPA: hypothetical protein VH592_08390 [Gemmataceae bacterium]|jgi:hypothetical protein